MSREYLKNTAFKFKDISEQPPSKYVMVLQGQAAVPQIAVAVDRIDVEDSIVYGYRDGQTEYVIAFPLTSVEFGTFLRGIFEPITREEALRRGQADLDALQGLKREIDPQGAEDTEMMQDIERYKLHELHKSVVVPDGKLKTGQYA